MADDKAKEIIAEWGREENKQANSRSLWQDTGDHMYPYVQITSEYLPGTNRTKRIYDMTPMMDMLDMVSGFKQTLVPAGQTFFMIKVSEQYDRNDRIQRYLSVLTELAHLRIYASNFMMKIDDVLTSMITFGPGCLFTEWKPGKGLNYKTSKIGSYIIIEDDSENVIGSIHRFKLTAQQAYEAYKEMAGPSVMKAMEKPETMQNEFWFLYKVCPRRKFQYHLSKTHRMNLPVDATVVNIADLVTVYEGGFAENPFAIGRWMRPEYEKDGRGIGTEMLPQIKVLFEMVKGLTECGNKWNNPPLQALVDAVEGEIRTIAGGLTWVNQIDAVRAMDGNMNGNFPITMETVNFQISRIDRAFYKNAFDPLADLQGDRRTTLEIQERIRGTLKKLGPPVGRLWGEMLTKSLERSILELIRNRDVPPPPPELAGIRFGIEYVGPLALALKSEQARGFQEWISLVGQAHGMFPEKNIPDNVDFDDAFQRMGRSLGVNTEDMTSVEERDAMRTAREQKIQQKEALLAAQAAGKAYKDMSGQAAPNSPAAQLAGV